MSDLMVNTRTECTVLQVTRVLPRNYYALMSQHVLWYEVLLAWREFEIQKNYFSIQEKCVARYRRVLQ